MSTSLTLIGPSARQPAPTSGWCCVELAAVFRNSHAEPYYGLPAAGKHPKSSHPAAGSPPSCRCTVAASPSLVRMCAHRQIRQAETSCVQISLAALEQAECAGPNHTHQMRWSGEGVKVRSPPRLRVLDRHKHKSRCLLRGGCRCHACSVGAPIESPKQPHAHLYAPCRPM